MGFMLKSAFWLGLVFSWMPLGEPSKVSEILSPEQQAAACSAASGAILAKVGNSADAYRGLAAMGCTALARTAPTVTSTSAPIARALTENDRKPPWLAPPLPPVRPRSG
jgi:hypothetical protein